LNDRTTARLVEKNCLAHRLFTRPPAPPVRRPTPARGDREPDTPAPIIVIDEMSMLAGIDSPVADAVRALVEEILRRGRSAGVLVVGATRDDEGKARS
jgi:hypothetical protein